MSNNKTDQRTVKEKWEEGLTERQEEEKEGEEEEEEVGHGAEIESNIQGENKKVSGCGIWDRKRRRGGGGGRTRRIEKGS